MTRLTLRTSTAAIALLLAGPAAAQEDLEAACDIPTLSAGNPDEALLQRCREAGFLTAGDVELLQAQDLPDEAVADEAAPEETPAAEEPAGAETSEAAAEEAEAIEEIAEEGVNMDPPAEDDPAGEDAEMPQDGEIVVDQAPEASVEEGAATEDSADLEATPQTETEAGDATIEIEGDGAEGLEGGQATVDLNPASEEAEGEDAAIVVDQAPEAEVPEGAATAEPDEAPVEEAPVEEAPEEATDGTEEVETPADEAAPADEDAAVEPEAIEPAQAGAEAEPPAAEAPAEAEPAPQEAGAAQADDPGAEPEVEPSEITTQSLEEALDEAVDQDAEAGGADVAPPAEETRDVGLGEQTEPTTPEERTGGEAADQDADPAGEAPAAEDAAESEAALEVPQEDTEDSAARANASPAAAAAAEDAALGEEAEAQVLTEEDTRSSDEAFAAEEDEDGLSPFERALLIGLGAVAVGSVLSDGGQIVENTGDRVVVERNGELQVLKNDDELLRRPGSTVSQRRYDDGSTLTVVEREDGSRVTTIRAANGQVLRRSRTLPDGTEIVLFDDTQAVEPVDVAELRGFRETPAADLQVDDLRSALGGVRATEVPRAFSLQQIREIRAVRELMPQVDVAAIEFDTGSAVIRPTEAEALRDIGVAMAGAIEANPDEVFLVEGHTDAVGSAASNLALSDRRAESVALALTEYFGVPPESMVAQGYGEANLKVRTAEAERENRRASVRRITPLLRGASAQ